jgi:hypothetical protein
MLQEQRACRQPVFVVQQQIGDPVQHEIPAGWRRGLRRGRGRGRRRKQRVASMEPRGVRPIAGHALHRACEVRAQLRVEARRTQQLRLGDGGGHEASGGGVPRGGAGRLCAPPPHPDCGRQCASHPKTAPPMIDC